MSSVRAAAVGDVRGNMSPLPADRAHAIHIALRERGPFLLPGIEKELVIRGGTSGEDPPGAGDEVPLHRVRVDTVWAVLEPHPNEREALQAAVEATFERPRTAGVQRAPLAGVRRRTECYRRGEVAVYPLGPEGAAWTRLKVELAPWRSADRTVFQDLLRAMASAHGDRIVFTPQFRLSRIDVACDYGTSPEWIVANRPRAHCFDRVENQDGCVTWYYGRRGRGNTLVRMYGGAARHPQDPLSVRGPWLRMEAEFRPSCNVEPSEDAIAAFLANASPFMHFDAAIRTAPGLSLVDSALVRAASENGYRWTMRKLSPGDRERLRAAWKALRFSDARIPTLRELEQPTGSQDALGARWWHLVASSLVHLLFFDPAEGDEDDVVYPRDAGAERWVRDTARRWDDPELRWR